MAEKLTSPELSPARPERGGHLVRPSSPDLAPCAPKGGDGRGEQATVEGEVYQDPKALSSPQAGFDPLIGERLAPAWIAAAHLLADADWHTRDQLIEVMFHASDVQTKTCANLLHGATREGWLRRRGSGRRGPAQYQVTQLGLRSFEPSLVCSR